MTDISKAGTYKLGSRTVKRLGYGAMQLDGPHVFGPPADRDAAVAVLREVVAPGITHIDTSDFYGPHVTNEIIREALHPYPDDLHLVTKVGAFRDAEGGWPQARAPRPSPRLPSDAAVLECLVGCASALLCAAGVGLDRRDRSGEARGRGGQRVRLSAARGRPAGVGGVPGSRQDGHARGALALSRDRDLPLQHVRPQPGPGRIHRPRSRPVRRRPAARSTTAAPGAAAG